MTLNKMNCLEYYYNQAVEPTEKATDYLLSRGLSREEIKFFGIRFFETRPKIKDSGKSDWKEFKDWATDGSLLQGKLVFPLWNSQGQLVALTLQSLGKFKTKFISHLSELEGVFYGLKYALESIWKTEEVFITEGVFDFHPLFRLFSNSLGILTANISAKQITFFKRYVKRIYSLLDNDKAGESGFVKLCEKIGKDIEVIRISYLAKDLGDLWEKNGEEGFQKAIQDQMSRLILL